MIFHCGSNLHIPSDEQFICFYKCIATIVNTCAGNEAINAVMFIRSERWKGGKHHVIIIYSIGTSVDLFSKFVLWSKWNYFKIEAEVTATLWMRFKEACCGLGLPCRILPALACCPGLRVPLS